MKAGGGLLRALALFQFAHGVLGPLEALFDGAGLGLRVRQELFSLVVGGQTAVKLFRPTPRVASTFQYSSGLKASISFSRSSMIADGYALDAARRQAASDFRHRKGLSL